MVDRLHDQPSEVEAQEGEVLVNGPDGVSISLTPEAALETSDRLVEGAIRAKGQQAIEANRKRSA